MCDGEAAIVIEHLRANVDDLTKQLDAATKEVGELRGALDALRGVADAAQLWMVDSGGLGGREKLFEAVIKYYDAREGAGGKG